MKLHDLFPGSFSAEHFLDGPMTLTIESITPIVFEEDGEQRQKGKMTFKECANYWVFGKEAAGELAEQIQSDETDDWTGHVIELRKDRTRFKGKMVDCVRGSFQDVERPVRAAIPAAREEQPEVADLERQLAEARAALAERDAEKVPA